MFFFCFVFFCLFFLFFFFPMKITLQMCYKLCALEHGAVNVLKQSVIRLHQTDIGYVRSRSVLLVISGHFRTFNV